MALKGKVAAILSDESVVINLGSAQNVTPGMRFLAVHDTGAIRDPDHPDQILGELTYEVAKLQVTTVFEKMSICSVPATPVAAITAIELSYLPKMTSRIDPAADRLLADKLRVRVGTTVVEAAPEPKSATLAALQVLSGKPPR